MRQVDRSIPLASVAREESTKKTLFPETSSAGPCVRSTSSTAARVESRDRKGIVGILGRTDTDRVDSTHAKMAGRGGGSLHV